MQTISLKTVFVAAALLCGLVFLPVSPATAQSEEEGAPAVQVTGGLITQIGAPYIADELRLSDEQQERIDALLESVREAGRAAVPVPDNGGEELTEEQKEEYRAALNRAAAEENAAAARQLREILDDAQYARLRQIWLQQIGLEGVIQPDVAAEIGLTEEQRATLEKMYAQELERNRAIPADRDPEDERAYREEWHRQWTGELNEEQRGKWSQMLGPPMALAQVPSGEGSPAAATEPGPSTSPRGPAAAPRTTTAPSETAETPAPLAPTGPVVASFDREGQTEEARPGDPVKFNFEYAPWPVVLKLFADRAGYILHLRETPPGTYTYRDPKSYTITEALDVLNGYLLQEGYVLVRRDNALVSLSVDGDQIPPNLIPEVTPDELVTRGRNELVSVIFPLEPGVDVEKLRDEIYEITGPQGNAVALTTASGIYVTDTAGNLRRIYDSVIKSVAPPRTPEDPVFRPYALTYLAADEAQYIVGELLGSTRTVPNVSAGGGGDGDRDRRGFPGWPQFGGDQGRGSDRDRQRGSTTSTPVQAKVTAELRTNQLLVTATPAQHKVVEELVKAIDVDTTGQPVRVGSLKPYLQVYRVTTDARETAKTLTALMPAGVVVNERGDDDTVHIFGTEAQHRQVQEYLRQLEGGSGFSTVSVIPLSSKDPLTVAATLRTVFLKDGTNAPTIEPDLQGRQLIVRGSSGQIDQIRTILLSMGETGTGERPRIGNSNVLHLNISGHDSQQFLEALERAWSTTNRAPLQIIPRGNGSLIRGIRTPDNRNGRDRLQDVSPDRAPPDATSTEPAAPARKDSAAHPGRRPDLFDVALQDAEAESSDDAAPAAPDAAANESSDADDEVAPAAPGSARAGLTILMQGDELIVMGRDPADLEALTSLADYLMSVMPVRTSWTIFTLQSGGADEVANMLKLLLPDVSVSSATPTTSSTSFFGGISNSFNQLGSGLADMTGLSSLGSAASLTIIPDARLNSLFVSGPESRVLEVEQLLEVLDASEWSAGELRERRPRMIEVKHAEVVDVYERVTEIYANYLESGQNSRGRNQQNPFQMLVGGGRGGGGGGGGQENEVKLTVSADTRTNHLIVSANDALFSEIEKMVEEMDQKVFEAKRTVRLVALQHASPNLVKNAVSTLMPKVTVSGTGGGNNGGGQQFGYPGFRGGDNDDRGGSSGDDVRRMMEFRERMRQQQSQPFGGGSQATGFPSFGGGDGGSRFGGFRGFGDGGSRFGGFGGDFGGRGGDRGRGDRGR